MADARAMLERFVAALGQGDWATAGSMIHPEFVDEMPQSGERTRGWENMRATLEQYPGAEGKGVAQAESVRVDSDESWAMTPAYTLVKVEGSGERYTVTGRLRYPDGTYWRMVILTTMKGGKIWRTTSYYAPEFPAPEWRKPWVERMDER
jgi:hypothetical protein